MASILDIIEEAKAKLSGDIERDQAVIADAVLRVSNLNAAEVAEANAYKVCHYCRRIYSEAQWSLLAPAQSAKWKLDGLIREEHRRCEVCDAELAVIERLVGRRDDMTVLTRVAEVVTSCTGCAVAIRAGEATMVRMNSRTGYRMRGTWCSPACEENSK